MPANSERFIDLGVGYAQFDPTEKQAQFVPEISRMLTHGDTVPFERREEEFLQSFFTIAGQKTALELPKPFTFTSASAAIRAVSTYLGAEGKTVSVIHPALFIIPSMLKDRNVPILPVSEDILTQPDKAFSTIKDSDALFLVPPNNPTGTEITQENFAAIVDFCKTTGKMLILDMSFRFYSDLTAWDQYALLRNSGIDFMVIEDTGKTWSLQGLKVGALLASESLYPKLFKQLGPKPLHMSPLTLSLLTQFIEAEEKPLHAQNIVNHNRQVVREALQRAGFYPAHAASRANIEMVTLPEGWRSSILTPWLAEHSLEVRSGTPFFWSNESEGEKYIRIALGRNTQEFKDATLRLKYLLTLYSTFKPRIEQSLGAGV